MKLLNILTGPWAIQPEKLLEIQEIYATHLRGDKIDIAGVEKRLGRPLANERTGYTLQNGVAIIPVDGVLAKRMNLMTEISGGSSSEQIARDIREAANDPAATAILLTIDSPGGTVDGTQAIADAISAARASKPTAAWTDGCMCSAAYWIGAAAGQVYIGADTAQVGSIGVVASHNDVSGKQAAAGIKTTEITAGKYKRIASQYEPLSQDGRATIQAQVDYLYSIFVGAVAKARGVSEEKVLLDMADGRVFIGRQAIAAGLVDGVSTLDALIDTLNQQASAGVADSQLPTSLGVPHMDRTKLAAEHPELVAALLAEGAAAERERIASVEAQALPGHESLIAKLKADGNSTGGDAAMQVLAAERAKLASMADRLHNDAPTPVPDAHAPEASADQPDRNPRNTLHRKAKQYQADHPGTQYIHAVRAVAQAA